MKRFVIIGLGNFNSVVARNLHELGHEVIVVDSDTTGIDDVGPHVTRAVAGDATHRDVLEAAGARGADAVVISTGENLGASVLAMLAARDLQIQEIFVKVKSEEHARIADALGATGTVFPEKEAAKNLASRITSSRLLHYAAFGEQFGIQEMAVPDSWYGKTLRDLRLPEAHQIHVVAVHDLLRDVITIPDPAKPLTQSETLLIAGAPAHLESLTRLR